MQKAGEGLHSRAERRRITGFLFLYDRLTLAFSFIPCKFQEDYLIIFMQKVERD